jgi:hypothetical protein
VETHLVHANVVWWCNDFNWQIWKEGAVVVVGGNVDGDNDSLPL